MRNFSKYFVVLLVMGSLLMFLPCAQAQAPTKILKVASINPLTGPAALWGETTVNKGLAPYAAMANHKGGVLMGGERYKVEFLWEDDKGTAVGARAAAEKLIFRDKVKFIVGTLMGSSNLAIAPLTTEQKMITIMGSGSVLIRPEFPYLFQTTPSMPQRIYCVVSVAKKKYQELKGKSKMAILSPDDESGIQMYKMAPKMLPEMGVEIVYNERHPRGTKDYYSFLTNVMATKPDALMLISSPTDVALIVKQSRELGFKGKILFPSTISDLDSFLRTAGEEASQGILNWYDDFNAPDISPRMRDFQEFYTKVLRRPADDAHSAAYILPIEILLQALEKANSHDMEKILKTLKTSEFDTMLGRVRFEGEKTYGIGNRVNAMVLFGEIKGRRIVHVGGDIYREP